MFRNEITGPGTTIYHNDTINNALISGGDKQDMEYLLP
jgi:hypothetical protein